MALTIEQEQWMEIHQTEALTLYKADRLNTEQKHWLEDAIPSLMHKQEFKDFLFSRGWTWTNSYHAGDGDWSKSGWKGLTMERAIAVELKKRGDSPIGESLE